MQKDALWKMYIEDWKASKLSQERFCQVNGLSIHTFKYWRCKLKSKKTGMPPVKIVQIHPDPQPTITNSFLLRYGKWELGVPPHFDESALIRLLSALERKDV